MREAIDSMKPSKLNSIGKKVRKLTSINERENLGKSIENMKKSISWNWFSQIQWAGGFLMWNLFFGMGK